MKNHNGISQQALRPRSGLSESNPAIYRWGTAVSKNVSPRSGRLILNNSRLWISVARYTGFPGKMSRRPSTEVLGYFHASASRTAL